MRSEKGKVKIWIPAFAGIRIRTVEMRKREKGENSIELAKGQVNLELRRKNLEISTTVQWCVKRTKKLPPSRWEYK